MKEAIKQGNWALVHETSEVQVMEGDVVTDFRGEADTITGGRPPHKPSSSGFVWTRDGREFYPSVFGLKWMQAE